MWAWVRRLWCSFKNAWSYNKSAEYEQPLEIPETPRKALPQNLEDPYRREAPGPLPPPSPFPQEMPRRFPFFTPLPSTRNAFFTLELKGNRILVQVQETGQPYVRIAAVHEDFED